MTSIFNWCAENGMLCTIIASVLCLLLGSKKVRENIAMFGFTLSQTIRKLLGGKFEEVFEEGIIGSLYRGLRSDNKKDSSDDTSTKK